MKLQLNHEVTSPRYHRTINPPQVLSRAKGKTLSDLSPNSLGLEQEFGYFKPRAGLNRSFSTDKSKPPVTMNPPFSRFGHSMVRKPSPSLRPHLHATQSFAGNTQDLSKERLARCRTRKMLARPPSFRTIHQLCEIEHQFVKSKPLLAAKRQLLHQGAMVQRSPSTSSPRQFFLFTDILMSGAVIGESQLRTNGGKHYHRPQFFSLGHCWVELDPTDSKGLLITTEKDHFRVTCPTDSQAQGWYRKLSNAIEAYRTRPRHLPTDSSHSSVSSFFRTLSMSSSQSVSLLLPSWSRTHPPTAPTPWIPDREATACMVCETTKFTLLVRRHHCRTCGYVICYRCSTPSGSFLKSRARTCLPCSSAPPVTPPTPTLSTPPSPIPPPSHQHHPLLLLSTPPLTSPHSPSETGSSTFDSSQFSADSPPSLHPPSPLPTTTT